jgi:hypothetical protein
MAHDHNQITAALADFFKSEQGQALIGNIVLKAVNQALTLDVQYEDGKSDPGRVVEKTETWHMRDWLYKYMPHIEGALRGVQADAATARNRAVQTRDMVTGIIDTLGLVAHGAEAAAALQDLAGRHQKLLIDYNEDVYS